PSIAASWGADALPHRTTAPHAGFIARGAPGCLVPGPSMSRAIGPWIAPRRWSMMCAARRSVMPRQLWPHVLALLALGAACVPAPTGTVPAAAPVASGAGLRADPAEWERVQAAGRQ